MTSINIKSLVKIASLILIILSAFFTLCLIVALIYNEPVQPFIWSAGITLIPGVILFMLVRDYIHEKVSVRDGYLAVTFS